MKELILRTVTGVLLVILMLGAILLGATPILIITLLIYGLGLRELFPLYESSRPVSLVIVSFAGGAWMLTCFLVLESYIPLYWLVLPSLIWVGGFVGSRFHSSGILVMFWMAIPLSSFFALGWINSGQLSNQEGYHHMLPLSVIVLVWINDTFAYLVGKIMGKHKLTPRLSPGKTWEGLIGGIIFSAIGGWIMYRFAETYDLWFWILLALITGVFGLMGDLFESGLKRKRNVKDTGGILPGHGGVLDRFDSLLFVAPVVLIVLFIINGSS